MIMFINAIAIAIALHDLITASSYELIMTS